MADETIDAKTEEASSASSESVENKETASTAVVETSTTQADQSQGLKDAISKAFETSDPKPEEKKEDKESSTEVDKDKSTEQSQEAKVEGDKTTEAVDKGPVPYERFQEVIAEKNSLTEYKTQAEPALRDYQGIVNHLNQNNVTPDEFRFWMDVAAKCKNDPMEAVKLLQPHLQSLQSQTGDVLPPDLQAAVESGEVTEKWAKELAKTRGKSTLVEKQHAQSREQIAAQQQQAYMQQTKQTLESWVQGKQSSDPDFKIAGKGEAGGKLELVMDKIAALWQSGQVQINSPQDIVKIAEQAYAAVNASLSRFKPKQNGSVHVRSSQSNRGVTPQINSIQDAVAAGLNAHRR